jgi:hypothetical protein
MRRDVLARRLGLLVGSVYVPAGIAETVRLVVTGDGGFAFWFGTLVGGGTLVLLGTLRPLPRRPWPRIAVILGAVAGIPATGWTVAVPVLAMVLVILRLAEPVERQAESRAGGSTLAS